MTNRSHRNPYNAPKISYTKQIALSDARRHKQYRLSNHRFWAAIMDDDSHVSKKAKVHEAHMIPGVDGDRIYGFPNSIITKLRYCTTYQITAAAGAMAVNVFLANSIFDPDYTGVGHQPLWRDSFASIYNHYVVLGSKINVTYGSDSNANHLIGIVGDDDISSSSTADTRCELNNSVSQLMGWASSAPPPTLTSTFEPLMAFGVDAKDDGASATNNGSSPAQVWCYHVWAQPQTTSTVVYTFKVEIEYTVKFTELLTQVQN